jgi:hypothetical protein
MPKEVNRIRFSPNWTSGESARFHLMSGLRVYQELGHRVEIIANVPKGFYRIAINKPPVMPSDCSWPRPKLYS